MRHLRLVSAISDEGSLTAAARVLDLTQPALSHQLRELEKRLRVPLYVRTARRMIPTPAGEHLTVVARTVLAQVSQFEREATSGSFSKTVGVIRLATECYTAYHWLPAVLRSFGERWPSVELRIATEHTSSPIAALREGGLDVAVIHRPVSDRRVQTVPLFDDELIAVVSPSHHWAPRHHVDLADFAREHLIAYSSAAAEPGVVRDILKPAGVTPARVTRMQLTEAIVELVSAGLGVAILARWSVAAAIRAGSIRAVRLTEAGWPRKWFVATRAADPPTPYLADLMGVLGRSLSAGPSPR